MNQPMLASATMSKRKRLGVAAILGSLSALGPLSIDMYLPAFPQLAEEMNATPSMIQLSLTACLVGIALGQLIVGPISDVKGRRKPLLIGMLLYAIVSALCIWSGSIWSFVVLRFVQGFAGAAGLVISRASVRDLYSGPDLIRFMATLMVINGAAPILAPVIGAEIISLSSWKGVFAALSIFGMLMLILIYVSLGETLPQDRRSRGGLGQTIRTFGLLLKDRSFIGYMMTQGFTMATMFAYISGSSFVLQGIYELSAREYSFVFGMNGLGIVLLGQVAGRLAHRVQGSTLLAIGLIYGSIGAITLLLSIVFNAPFVLVMIGLFAVVSSVGLINTTANSLALQEQGNRAGSASALLGMSSFLFGGLIAPVVGLGGESTAMPMASIMLVLMVCAVLSYTFAQRRRSAAAADSGLEA